MVRKDYEKLFSYLETAEPPEGFLDNILSRIQREKRIRAVKIRLAFSAFVIAALIIPAGVFGPSASTVAHAQAQQTINRSLTLINQRSDEEKVALEQRFQKGLYIKDQAGERFISTKELSPEHEAMIKAMSTSFKEALAEAQNATDLRVISADEMPIAGFFGNAGRAFGLRMMKHHESFEDKLANLPEDIRKRFNENGKLTEEAKPVTFLTYTNTEGLTVHLGLNADDEPVMKFVRSNALGGKIKIKFGE
ncbi:MAG: hypothetical protein IBX64_11170 [Actinobacteria bacterium]|nr:hypothetical protein [Actinomycetota bacterium]